jgi:hypothetical protein
MGAVPFAMAFPRLGADAIVPQTCFLVKPLIFSLTPNSFPCYKTPLYK